MFSLCESREIPFAPLLCFSLSLSLFPFRRSTSGRRIGKDDASTSTSTSLGGASPFKYKPKRRSGRLPVGASRRSCDRHRRQKVASPVAQDQCEQHAAYVRDESPVRARYNHTRGNSKQITERSMSEGSRFHVESVETRDGTRPEGISKRAIKVTKSQNK